MTVGDPILIKNQEGQAVYICNYYYNGAVVGGIILNAKTGAVIYRELYIPSNLNTDTSSNNNDYYTDQNYNDNSNDNYDTNNDNYDDSSDYSSDSNYDDNYDDSSDYSSDSNYDDSYDGSDSGGDYYY